MNRGTACNAKKMKMNNSQVQNEQIFSLEKSKKNRREIEKKEVMDEGQREGDNGVVCGVVKEDRRGDR